MMDSRPTVPSNGTVTPNPVSSNPSQVQLHAFYVAVLTIAGSFMLLTVLAILYGTVGLAAGGGIVGTWVGVIVTYYFTREQVKSAAETGKAEGGSLYFSLVPEYLKVRNELEQTTSRLDELGKAYLANLPPEEVEPDSRPSSGGKR